MITRLTFGRVQHALIAATFICLAADAAATWTLITRDGRVESVELIEVAEDRVTTRRGSARQAAIATDEVLALLRTDAQLDSPPHWLRLTDGQRLPGGLIASGGTAGDVVRWDHPWLGRVRVPLEEVAAATFGAEAAAASGAHRAAPAAPAVADVVRLANGDRLEGFVIAIDDPLSIEVQSEAGEASIVDVPLDAVVSVTLVTPERPAEGTRLWTTDGSVIAVSSLEIGDDGYVRMTTPWRPQAVEPERVRVEDVAAVQFAASSLRPLAALRPSDVAGPSTRYIVPEPEPAPGPALLDLADVSLRGPVTVRYALPAGVNRFVATAMLAPQARVWGDCELVISIDDEQVFRQPLSARSPEAAINLPVSGAELTIELTAGQYGPIQDHVVLQRPMLILARDG